MASLCYARLMHLHILRIFLSFICTFVFAHDSAPGACRDLLAGYFTPQPEIGDIFRADNKLFAVVWITQTQDPTRAKIPTVLHAAQLNKKKQVIEDGKLFSFTHSEVGQFYVVGHKTLHLQERDEIWFRSNQDLPPQAQKLARGSVFSHPHEDLRGFYVVESINAQGYATVRKLSGQKKYNPQGEERKLPLIDGEFLKATIHGFIKEPFAPGNPVIWKQPWHEVN